MKRRWTTRLVTGVMLAAGMGCQSAPKFPLTDSVPLMPEGSVATTKPKTAAPIARTNPKTSIPSLPETSSRTSIAAAPSKPAEPAATTTSALLDMPMFSTVAAPNKSKPADLDLKLPDLTPSSPPSPTIQAEAIAPNKPLEKSAGLKLDEGMKGTEVVPAVKSEKIPLITSEKVSEPEVHSGHAPDYRWVVGVLDRHQRGAYWTVRYAGLGEEDRWGGKVRLMEDTTLPNLRSGDIVRVEGEILAPESAANVVPGGFSYPPYRVKSIQVISKGE